MASEPFLEILVQILSHMHCILFNYYKFNYVYLISLTERKEHAWEKSSLRSAGESHSAILVFLINDFVTLPEKWKMFFQFLIS